MAKICSVLKYEGDNKTLIWKHPEEDFDCYTQLIVHESQEAIFFMNGEALDVFPAGRHTLETESLPILSRVLGRATGDKTPFHCEVYFINKTEQMDIKWGTDSKIGYVDANYGYPINIGASGNMSFVPKDSKKLLLKLVGTESGLSQSKTVEYLRAFYMTSIKSYLAQTLKEKAINIFEIDAELDMFSEALFEKIAPDFAQYGIELKSFKVETILKPEGDKNYEKLKELSYQKVTRIQEAKIDQQEQVIRAETDAQKTVIESQARARSRAQEGYTYAQEKGFGVMQAIAENEGAGADLRNAGMGLGIGFGVGGAFGAVATEIAGSTMGSMSALTSTVETAATSDEVGTVDVSPTAGETVAAVSGTTSGEAAEVTGEPAASGSLSAISEFETKVQKLIIMKNAGLISEAEFEAKKAELLGSI